MDIKINEIEKHEFYNYKSPVSFDHEILSF